MNHPFLLASGFVAGGVALLATASLLAVTPFFLLASVAKLISITQKKWKSQMTRRPKKLGIPMEEGEFWGEEYQQSVATKSNRENKERRAA